MLAVELTSSLLSEPGHLHPVYLEAISLNGINDLSNMCIGVWLDHSKRSLGVYLELPSCRYITIVIYLEES